MPTTDKSLLKAIGTLTKYLKKVVDVIITNPYGRYKADVGREVCTK